MKLVRYPEIGKRRKKPRPSKKEALHNSSNCH